MPLRFYDIVGICESKLNHIAAREGSPIINSFYYRLPLEAREGRGNILNKLTAGKDRHFGEFGKLVATVDVSPVAYKSARKCAGGSIPPLSTTLLEYYH